MSVIFAIATLVFSADAPPSIIPKNVIEAAFESQTQHMETVEKQTQVMEQLLTEIQKNTAATHELIKAIQQNGFVEVVQIHEPAPPQERAEPISIKLVFYGIIMLFGIIWFGTILYVSKMGNKHGDV